MNPEDLLETVHLTQKQQFLNGCCGPDGGDGPNQICECGAEIGTIMSDCWTPHAFIPAPKATSWVEEKS
jgi:hypothetical protein